MDIAAGADGVREGLGKLDDTGRAGIRHEPQDADGKLRPGTVVKPLDAATAGKP